MISVIIPAHNEQEIIEFTIKSVFGQTLPPDQVIVVADNCTDQTVKIASDLKNIYGNKLVVYETKDNKTKKSGALNQVFSEFDLHEYVLVMDADTILDSRVLEEGMSYFNKNPNLGAVCSKAGVMDCKSKSLYNRFIWNLQKLEYAMFDTSRVESFNKIKVCHGMCTLYKLEALRFAEQYRKKKYGLSGVYLEDNLVEDYELTLCIKQNYEVTANLNMLAWTEVPETLKELWVQRLRWFRGGVDCMLLHGYNKVTRYELLNHLMFFVIVGLQIALTTMGINIWLEHGFCVGSDYLLLSLLFFGSIDGIYRLKYVYNLKLSDVVIRVLLVPELIYRWFQIASMLYSYYLSIFKIRQSW